MTTERTSSVPPGSDVELPDSRMEKPPIVVDAADCVNYASWQNSVPFLRSIEINNPTDANWDDVVLELQTTPGFMRSKRWVIQQVRAGSSLTLRDRDVEIDPDYLNGLNEAERGIARFRLIQQDCLLAETTHNFRVLARDEWGGMQSMGELLAAFVTPNDPALGKLLKQAAGVLAKHGHSSALDGYQSGSPSRAYLLAASLWSAVASHSLTYANPPSSFEEVGQKTRRISTVLEDGLATCLDSTLLFAAALEAVGLNPVIVMKQGHCFAGVWLVEKTLSRMIEPDCSAIRKAIAAKELVAFETTLVTYQPPGRFKDAAASAAAATEESEEREFVAAIDVARARMSQIRPLASHNPREEEGSAPPELSGPLPLPAAPSFDELSPSETEEKPATPDGRVDRWQRKLLDLSLRNRLLNFRATKQAVPIVCPNVSRLEDRLADGDKLRLISLPDENPIGERDAELHQQKTLQNLDQEFARQALDRKEVACSLTGADLDKRLTGLYRKVRSDLAEGGSNTLYLAVGFLKWKETPDAAKIRRAPLLLVPVKLLRKSASSPYDLAHHEDEVRFNATLIQLLKKDFDCDIPDFERELPTDDSGVDVPRILEMMRKAVRDIPGFEVVEETALSTFTFSKYLMWKDLVDRADQLEMNRVVRHLIKEPDKQFSSDVGSAIPQSQEIDCRYTPAEIVHPLPADSSQLAAVMAASEGHDFVLVGPPGTGKSQTIANIIAQCMAIGKTVLFVAEKTAALDVVYRRLREHGLGDCCVELHSNKAERRRFLDQLGTSWEGNRRPRGHDWLTISERLKIRRDELNDYVAAIHTKHPNGWTAYRALGISVAGKDLPAPEPAWANTVQHDEKAFKKLRQTIKDIALTFGAIDPEAALPRVKTTEWSAAWEASLLENAQLLKTAATDLKAAIGNLTGILGAPEVADCSKDEIGRLNQLAQSLLKCANQDVSILFHEQFAEFPNALDELREAIDRLQQAKAAAAASYPQESLDQIPVEEFDKNWREAKAAMWPLSWFAKRKATRLLQSYASEGVANPASDLRAIVEMRKQLAAIDASLLAEVKTHWQATETDVAQLEAHLQLAREVREAIIGFGSPRKATNAISKAIFPALNDTSGDLSSYRVASSYLEYWSRFAKTWSEFTQTAGGTPVGNESAAIAAESVALAERIESHRTQLKHWTAWQQVKKRAEALGLAPFVSSLESGAIEPADLGQRFELTYARWWLPRVIDSSDALRTFQRFQHEDAIEDFRTLDDLARQTAASRAREAVAHDLPQADQVPKKSELGLLRHQMRLKRPSKSIREVISGMPESFGKLAPCLLMSPLSIAQYLPVNQSTFDVVLFDEASQITTWDAIGAIARGKQTVIVGDPKQLPPTNFFGRTEDDEENDDLEDHEKDLESILDEAQASGLPTLQLNWHYRSRHESLIAFSNWNYYGNKLVTFPAADASDCGVLLRCQPEAIFDRGKSRTNRIEAEGIVADAVARMRTCLTKPEAERLTYGVITFNTQQQSLIQDLFDEALREYPELEWFFSDDRIEPTAVKNLENVQGDERDVMYFSITFGFDVAGKFSLNFGALNRDGGERRLNVAVTRARRSLIVYTSFMADQLRTERTQARGVHDLKSFIEYAEKGTIALAARSEGSVGELESPFEESVAEALASLGWQVEPQIGVSGFRVDLGIIHPDKPGAYLAGVECDGATYHRSAAARDRDKTRQQVLENLGWNIVRVWSPDWWYDSESALDRVHESLTGFLEADRAAVNTPTDELPETPAHERDSQEDYDHETDTELELEPVEVPALSAMPTREPLVARQQPVQTVKRFYERAELPDAAQQQDRFFDDGYTDELRAMTREVLECEAPIREDLLAREITRAHGYGRTGAKLRERILSLVSDVKSTDEQTGRFLWNGNPQRSVAFRYAKSDDERRSVDGISIAELVGFVEANRDLLDHEDPALALARELGLARLAQSARERIEEAIELFQE